MKELAKRFVAAVLGRQVRALHKRNRFQIIAVGGSVGKTSTKLAVADVLKTKYRVCYQDGNYNDLVSVPLIFFGEKLPNLMNPLSWLAIFWRNHKQIGKPYPFDIVVVEVGTDAPGQIRDFNAYLKADIGVLTGITPEHMASFADLGAVAKEELGLIEFSKNLIYNKDLCAAEYMDNLNVSKLSYGLEPPADFQSVNIKYSEDKCDFEVLRGGKNFMKAANELVSEPQLYSVTAAIAVSAQLGMTAEEIGKGLHNIGPVNGRMRRLKGIHGSLILDDTYNASPEAMHAALKTLYRIPGKHKIALLGNMNELGSYSAAEHRAIGAACDPAKLDLVITVGPDANTHLAAAAKARGCEVSTFEDPYRAGEFIKGQVKGGTIILAKGSQNGVFAEEALKPLLADQADCKLLVRQSPQWLRAKTISFGGRT